MRGTLGSTQFATNCSRTQSSFGHVRRQVSQQARCRCTAIKAANVLKPSVVESSAHSVTVSFSVHYKCNFGQTVALVGNAAELGQWSARRGVRMRWGQGDVWKCSVTLPAGSPLECKYVVVDDKGGEVRWQEGSNMALQVPTSHDGLPVQQYDVRMSWCKSHAAFSAKPLAQADASASLPTRAVESAAILASGTIPGERSAPVAARAVINGSRPASETSQAAAATAAAAAVAAAPAVPVSAPAKALAEAPAGEAKGAAAVAAVAAVSATQQRLTLPEPAVAPISLEATIRQAAANAAQAPLQTTTALALALPAATTASATAYAPAAAVATAASSAALPTIQLTPGNSEEPLSLVLPPRSNSPPFKVSLSPSFAKLMEIPSLPPSPRTSTSGAAGGYSATSIAPGASSSAGSNGVSGSGGWNSVSGKAPAPAVRNHSLDDDFAVSNSRNGAQHNGNSSMPAPAGKTPRGAAQQQSYAPLQSYSMPGWGHEYDIYSNAYDAPYMHTAFDLDAYAMYEPTAPEPAPAARSGGGASHGPMSRGNLLSRDGADFLESAVQAARSGPTSHPLSSTTNPISTFASASASVATPAPPVTTPVPEVPTLSPPPPNSEPYRQTASSSPTVRDWASRTLFELSSGRGLGSMDGEEDSDDDETADDEAALAHAMAAPVAPAEMAALLTQLGSALGRSVRLRYEGLDVAASDLLELDRKIALAASKLYRQRDSLLTGWVRKETRRQLSTTAAAAVAAGRSPSSGRAVTPM